MPENVAVHKMDATFVELGHVVYSSLSISKTV
jgi:hypothetical protein